MIFGRSKQEREGTLEELRLLFILAEMNNIPVDKIVLSESAYNEIAKHVSKTGEQMSFNGTPLDFHPDIQLLTEEQDDE